MNKKTRTQKTHIHFSGKNRLGNESRDLLGLFLIKKTLSNVVGFLRGGVQGEGVTGEP